MTIEICANSVESALNSQMGGAHRIEFCRNLEVGGLTPLASDLEYLVQHLRIPVFVLIRPRPGNFVYTELEVKAMLESIAQCKKIGCHGIVAGILNDKNEIDTVGTSELVKAAYPLPFTFHRAFDQTPNAVDAFKRLQKLGVQRVLTSGQQISAVGGLDLLLKLKTLENDTLKILPGAGINSGNAKLFLNSGFTELHSSATSYQLGTKWVKSPVSQVEEIQKLVGLAEDRS